MRKILLFFLLFFVIVWNATPTAFAQIVTPQANTKDSAPSVEGLATLGVAKMVDTKQKDLKDGSILSSSENGAVLSTIPYDSQVIGIVSRDAGVIVNTTNNINGVPVIADGSVYVLVSTKNGNIKKGDYLTSSTIPGVGVKAVNEGYVLGTALEDYVNPDPKKIDKIAVTLNLHYFNSKPTLQGTLSDILKLALLPTKDAPTPIFKYIVAALVVLGSFTFGFLTFGRTAAKGVEALGRNPAASSMIHLGIIFNVTIVVAIVGAGLVVAFLILRL